MTLSTPFFTPQWPIANHVRAYSTLRYPGNSWGVYKQFNLALHVDDDERHVLSNRQQLMQLMHLPSTPKWLNQTHSSIALLAETISLKIAPNADASYTQKTEEVCVVMTADCLPILITNKEGTEVAAIHAGWQGLAKDVIENTLSKLSSKPESLLIWIGPSIQQANYEVGEDFYAAFATSHTLQEMHAAFLAQQHQKWLANVPLLAVQRLMRCGVLQDNIYLSGECTYANCDKYFSYRRDGVTGRMASLIWIENNGSP